MASRCLSSRAPRSNNDAVAEAAESTGTRAMLAGFYLWDQIEIMRHLGSLESRSLYDRAPPKLERLY
jgi:hypothetical protein